MICLTSTATILHQEPVTSRAQRFLQKKTRFCMCAVAQSFCCLTPNSSTLRLSNSHHHLPQTSSQMLHSLCVDVTVGTTSPARHFPNFSKPIRSLMSSSRLRSAGGARTATSPSCPIHPCTVKSGFHFAQRLQCPSSPLPLTAWSPVWASRRP